MIQLFSGVQVCSSSNPKRAMLALKVKLNMLLLVSFCCSPAPRTTPTEMGRTCSPTPVGLADNLYGLQAWFQVLSLVIMCWLDTSSGRPWWAQSKCGLDCILTFLNVLGVTCWAVALKVCSFLLNVKCWQGEKHLWAFSLCTPVSVHTGKQSLEHFTFCLVEYYIRALLSCGSPICNWEPVSSTSRTASSILLFLAFIFLQPLSNGNELRKELGIWNRRFFTAGSFKAALPAELQLLPLTFIRRTAVREAAWEAQCLMLLLLLSA